MPHKDNLYSYATLCKILVPFSNQVAPEAFFRYFRLVSATEIINDLPSLTEEERRAVRRKLVELAAENQDIAGCDQAALEGALLLDRMEEDDAANKSR